MTYVVLHDVGSRVEMVSEELVHNTSLPEARHHVRESACVGRELWQEPGQVPRVDLTESALNVLTSLYCILNIQTTDRFTVIPLPEMK